MITWVLRSFEQLTNKELYAIMQLRQEVFVVEQNCPYLDADGKDRKSEHLMGFIGSDLVAYSRLVPPKISYAEVSIGRVVTSLKYRKQHFGEALMKQSIIEIEKLYGRVPIRIGAQAYLKKFYEKFGFEDLIQPYLEDGIPHIIMLKSP